ncbi:MAG TPA: hypothetical protein PLR91_10075 [Kiritimatiellia bacterium]|nr:hypothetical protein [Kiritimatiellia bacterium]
MSKKLFLVMACLSWTLCLPVVADQKDDEIATLKEQVKQLRAENQALRLQLGQGKGEAATSQETSPQPTTDTQTKVIQKAQSPQQAEQSYWLTTSSTKRHNSGCRYYKTSKGRPCTKEEGIPCKVCGG